MARLGIGTIIAGVVVVGLAAVWMGRSKQQSQQEQKAQQALEHEKAEAQLRRDALIAKTRQEVEELEAKARLKEEEIEAKTDQQVDALQARASEQEAAQREAGNAANQQPAKDELSGTIAAINAGNHTVAIQEDGNAGPLESGATPTQLTLDDNVRVLHGDQPISLWDLRTGDHVKVEILQSEAGRRTVQTIIRAPVAGLR